MLLNVLCPLLFTFVIVYGKKPDVIDPPLGVPLNRGPLYNTGPHFKCFDGSKTILSSQINDDYCDCADGSDEPGTSACPNSKFFCSNKGHKSEFIPTSRVNDKICDCCDGSDEYAGHVTCPNICDELGKSAREERERLAEIARKGHAVRVTLAQEGTKLKDEKLKNAEPMKIERDQLQPERTSLEEKKKAAEEIERKLKDEHRAAWEATKAEKKKVKAAALFQEFDINQDQKITVDELQQQVFLDTDHDGTVSENEAKMYLTVDEADFDHFQNNMYDSLVSLKKRHDEDIKEEQQKEQELADDLVADEDKAIDHTDIDTPEEEDDDVDVMPPYAGETQTAIDNADAARRAFDDVDIKVRDIERNIKEAEDFAAQDFGHDFAWAPLKGQCFEMNENQYTYRICPFDRTVQKDRNGHSETSLGNFKSWAGPDSNKYSVQKYEGGQQCWNGPQRSTEVVIECGDENVLVEASEPAKCEYRFVFRSPAACIDPDKEPEPHTEL